MLILVSIPQAVSTVATSSAITIIDSKTTKVSIPQAVSTVATIRSNNKEIEYVDGFNTASGKYCCNSRS